MLHLFGDVGTDKIHAYMWLRPGQNKMSSWPLRHPCRMPIVIVDSCPTKGFVSLEVRIIDVLAIPGSFKEHGQSIVIGLPCLAIERARGCGTRDLAVLGFLVNGLLANVQSWCLDDG